MNLRKFQKRLKSVYLSWAKNKRNLWNDAEILIICTPPKSSKIDCPKSSSFFKWLLGFDLPDALMVLSCTKIYFACLPKKELILKSLKESVNIAVGVDLEVHANEKGSNGFRSKLDEILRMMVMENSESGLKMKGKHVHDDEERKCVGSAVVVGWIQEEAEQGNMLVAADKKKGKRLDVVWKDVTDGFLRVARIKKEGVGKMGEEEEGGDLGVDELKESGGDDGVLVEIGVGREGGESEDIGNGFEMDSMKKRGEGLTMVDGWIVL